MYAIEWELSEQQGEEGAMAHTITVETDECNTHSRVAKRDAKATSNLERWGKSGNPSVLWAETTLEDRPGCNSIHENWQVPSQEILNATTRLERIRALGGWEAANPHCRLTQDLLGAAC